MSSLLIPKVLVNLPGKEFYGCCPPKQLLVIHMDQLMTTNSPQVMKGCRIQGTQKPPMANIVLRLPFRIFRLFL